MNGRTVTQPRDFLIFSAVCLGSCYALDTLYRLAKRKAVSWKGSTKQPARSQEEAVEVQQDSPLLALSDHLLEHIIAQLKSPSLLSLRSCCTRLKTLATRHLRSVIAIVPLEEHGAAAAARSAPSILHSISPPSIRLVQQDGGGQSFCQKDSTSREHSLEAFLQAFQPQLHEAGALHLQGLHVSITAAASIAAGARPHLRQLVLDSCTFSSGPDSSDALTTLLSALPHLTHLALSDVEVVGSSIPLARGKQAGALSKLPGLTHLLLSDTGLPRTSQSRLHLLMADPDRPLPVMQRLASIEILTQKRPIFNRYLHELAPNLVSFSAGGWGPVIQGHVVAALQGCSKLAQVQLYGQPEVAAVYSLIPLMQGKRLWLQQLNGIEHPHGEYELEALHIETLVPDVHQINHLSNLPRVQQPLSVGSVAVVSFCLDQDIIGPLCEEVLSLVSHYHEKEEAGSKEVGQPIGVLNLGFNVNKNSFVWMLPDCLVSAVSALVPYASAMRLCMLRDLHFLQLARELGSRVQCVGVSWAQVKLLAADSSLLPALTRICVSSVSPREASMLGGAAGALAQLVQDRPGIDRITVGVSSPVRHKQPALPGYDGRPPNPILQLQQLLEPLPLKRGWQQGSWRRIRGFVPRARLSTATAWASVWDDRASGEGGGGGQGAAGRPAKLSMLWSRVLGDEAWDIAKEQ